MTTIEWTDQTWNPVTGCTRVSPGCANCYIERTPPFRMAGRRFAVDGQESTTGVLLHPERLNQPARWRKPRRVFVCSLADLFHDDVPDEYIVEVFDAMRLAPAHTFQVLTKRPERAAELLPEIYSYCNGYDMNDYEHDGQPLPNVWVGVSIENARYTWRADVLREIPAAVRFISAEPLLGSLYPKNAPTPDSRLDQVAGHGVSAPEGGTDTRGRAALDLSGIDWVIIGGESGSGARPFHLEHAREIIEITLGQCKDCLALGAKYAFDDWHPGFNDGRTHWASCSRRTAIFVKQLGARPHVAGREGSLTDRKGGDMDEWPEDLRIREFPNAGVLLGAA